MPAASDAAAAVLFGSAHRASLAAAAQYGCLPPASLFAVFSLRDLRCLGQQPPEEGKNTCNEKVWVCRFAMSSSIYLLHARFLKGQRTCGNAHAPPAPQRAAAPPISQGSKHCGTRRRADQRARSLLTQTRAHLQDNDDTTALVDDTATTSTRALLLQRGTEGGGGVITVFGGGRVLLECAPLYNTRHTRTRARSYTATTTTDAKSCF
jgi:hypothetical protein